MNNGISIGIISEYSMKSTEEVINKVTGLFSEKEYEIIILKEKDCNFNEADDDLNVTILEYDEKKDLSEIKSILAEKANYSWILLLESDDIIKEINENSLYDIIDKNEKLAYQIEVINHNIVNGKDFSYSTKETRFFHKEAKQEEALDSFIIEKKNYLLEDEEKVRDYLFKKKIKALEENREDKEESYKYFQIALAYKMNGDNQKTREYLEKAMELPIDTNKGYVQVMIVMYGNLLLEMEEYGQALLLENLYEYFEEIADYLCLMGRIYLSAGFVDEAIREFSKALNTYAYIEEGNNSYIPNYHMGCIYEVAGDIEIAKKLYQRCGNYKPALARLAEIGK